MGGEMVAESWFSSFWRPSRKNNLDPEKEVVGVLVLEVTRLMSKLVNLWKSLSDVEILKLREEILNSFGIRKLVSDADDVLMDLALNEMIENWGYVAKSVIRLGNRCRDPVFHRFEQFFGGPLENSIEWYGLEYRGKKMERKVKKMERFIAGSMQLFQELEVLAELEQTLRRMQANADISKEKLLEFKQKVAWQHQEVKTIREMSPWNRTFGYTVRLLSKSLFTILDRIIHVFGVPQKEPVEGKNVARHINVDCLPRSQSFSALMQSTVHPSENNICGFYSGPLGRPISKSIADKSKSKSKQGKAHNHSSILFGRIPHSKSKRLATVGPFKGCMVAGSDSPVLKSSKPIVGGSMRLAGPWSKTSALVEDTSVQPLSLNNKILTKLCLFNSKCKLSNSPLHTLADVALALHYANVIILLEKLASSPHLIGPEARDDLYSMLPTTVRASLRAKLKSYSKILASTVYDAALAEDWSLALMRIFEWLAPLAHNTIRWQSERNFEKQQVASGSNVLLVQTLHYANQTKTEAAVTELLMGLNYLWRFERVINENTSSESEGCRTYDNYM